MTQPQKTGQETQDLSNPVLLDSSRRQFQAAWDEALNGGPEPQLETYLAGSSETDRVVLRLALEQIDREYRQRRGQVGQSTNDATIGFTAANASDTPEPSPDATVAFAPGQPPGLTPTVNISPGAAGDLAFVTDGNQGGAGRAEVQADRRPEPSNLERPTVAGYDILGELGRGGMGVVYRAHHKKLSRKVALKMVLAGAHAGSDQLARFYTEAQAVAHLQHANIVQIYEVGEQAGLPYFSLELVDGGSLSQKMSGKPLPDQEAAALIETLARAMHHAHQNGIVHRDLKPANVLLTMSGVPKITDFGLAKRLEGESSSQTRSGAILGTPSYMAPEQAMGEVHQIGPLTDVYALGAMLYEMLTGRPPFLAATAMDTVLQVVRDEPVAPTQLQPKVPADLETICLKCLQKEQLKRYATAEALAQDLRRFLAGEPILARPVSAPERLWRWCRRNPRIASLSAAVLVLLVMGLVGSLAATVKISHEKKGAEDARDLADRNATAEKEARLIADQKTEEALAAQKEADANGILAVNTLYNVVKEVLDQLKDRDDMQTLRQSIVKGAMKGLSDVTGKAQSSALAGRVRGVAFQKMGDISMQLGQTEEALQQYQQSLETYEKMLAADPASDVAKYSVAALCEKVGDMLHQLDAIAAAAAPYYQRSLQLREKLAAQEKLVPPVTPERVRQALANAYSKQWSLSDMLGDPRRAYDYYRKFEATIATSKTGKPDVYLPSFYLRLSPLYFHIGDAEEARRNCEKAIQLSKEDVAADPLSVVAKKDLANSYGALGDLELYLLKPESSLNLYRQHHELQRELAAKNPDNSEYQRDLSLALYRLGTAELALSQIEESDKHHHEALEIRRTWATADPRNAFKQVEYILSLARCGNHSEAAEKAGELRQRVQQDPGMLFYVASGYSLCLPALTQGKTADQLSPEEQQLQKQYADGAIKAIEAAIALGYKDPVALQCDPDLEPIRKDPRFTALIERLKQP